MRYLLSRKEQESVVFVKEEFLLKKIFWDIFEKKLADTKEGSVKQMVYGGLRRP